MKEVGIRGLEITAALTLALIFGIIAGVIAIVLYLSGASGWGGVMFAILLSFVFLGIQWYIGPSLIKMITGARELAPNEHPELHEMVRKLSREARIPIPKLYMVNNNSPNAFAFGRTQGSSCVAVHSGLLNLLKKEEIEGVLAHEIGHIKHRDVLAMTIASVLPIMLYFIILVTAQGGGRNRGAGMLILVYFGAIAARMLGQLVVLWLSRKREYYADAFSAYATGSAVPLMGALAKITYKMPVQKMQEKSPMSAFYIADPSIAEKMRMEEIVYAINSKNDGALREQIEKEKRMGKMELLMTHPLTVKRLEALLRIKKELGM